MIKNNITAGVTEVWSQEDRGLKTHPLLNSKLQARLGYMKKRVLSNQP